MKVLTEFGREVRKLRIELAMTLREMAGELEVTPAYLSGVETGPQAHGRRACSEGDRTFRTQRGGCAAPGGCGGSIKKGSQAALARGERRPAGAGCCPCAAIPGPHAEAGPEGHHYRNGGPTRMSQEHSIRVRASQQSEFAKGREPTLGLLRDRRTLCSGGRDPGISPRQPRSDLRIRPSRGDGDGPRTVIPERWPHPNPG